MPLDDLVYRLDASNAAGVTIPLPSRKHGLVTLTVTIVHPLNDMVIPLDDLAGWDCWLYALFDRLTYRPGFNYMELLFVQRGDVVARGANGARVDGRTFTFRIPSNGRVHCVFNDVYYANNHGAVTIRVGRVHRSGSARRSHRHGGRSARTRIAHGPLIACDQQAHHKDS